jgi:hypothetical protein
VYARLNWLRALREGQGPDEKISSGFLSLRTADDNFLLHWLLLALAWRVGVAIQFH